MGGRASARPLIVFAARSRGIARPLLWSRACRILPRIRHASGSVIPSPNHDGRQGARDHTPVALHRNGDRRGGLQRLCSPDEQGLVALRGIRGRRRRPMRPRGAARVACRRIGVGGRNRPSIPVRSASRSSIPGTDFGYPDFPDTQIKAVIALCQDIIARHRIPADRVLAHSDVAPSRKQDPGEKFPWRRLHEAGVGHWVAPAPFAEGRKLAFGSRATAVRDLQLALARYGYGVFLRPAVSIAHQGRGGRIPAPFPSGARRRNCGRVDPADAERAHCSA